MLDNPFIIFDNSFVRLFFILIGIAFLIYRFQLIITVIDGFKNWRNRKNKYEADKLEYELDNLLGKKNIHASNKTDIIFNLLDINNINNEYFVYLSITGDPIRIIDIVSKDFNLISIESRDQIKNNLSFNFSFFKIVSNNNIIHFEIIYEDQFTNKGFKKYLIDLSEKTLKEIK